MNKILVSFAIKLVLICFVLDMGFRGLDLLKNYVFRTHPFLEPFKAKFNEESARFSIKIPDTNRPLYLIGELPIEMAGVCYGVVLPWKRSLYLSVIVVNERYWARLSNYGKEALVFHEMGHCVLGRIKHIETTVEQVPVSLMYPILLDPFVYKQNRDMYLKELFSH